MYMDDDTQKEKTIIPSLGGVKDVFMGRSRCFQLLKPEDSILVKKRIESYYSSLKGIDP